MPQPASTPYCFAYLSKATATQVLSSPTQTTDEPHGFSLSAEADRRHALPLRDARSSGSRDWRPLGSQE
jgi:hypothetical protein